MDLNFTIDTNGNEQIINMKYVTHVEISTVGSPTGHPCCGEKGDIMLRVSIAHSSNWIRIVCNHDGEDITEVFLSCFKRWAMGEVVQ